MNECLAVIKKRNKVVLTAGAVGESEAYYEKGYEQGGDIEQELEKFNTLVRFQRFANSVLDSIKRILLMSCVTVGQSVKPVLIFKDILNQPFI